MYLCLACNYYVDSHRQHLLSAYNFYDCFEHGRHLPFLACDDLFGGVFLSTAVFSAPTLFTREGATAVGGEGCRVDGSTEESLGDGVVFCKQSYEVNWRQNVCCK